jgi:PleD family two-component response regulator
LLLSASSRLRVSEVGQAHLATAMKDIARFKNLVDTKGECREF